MIIARWMAKDTDTHSEYAIFTAFSLQQWLSKCAPMLRYTFPVIKEMLYIVLLFTYTNSTSITLGDITEHEENPSTKK